MLAFILTQSAWLPTALAQPSGPVGSWSLSADVGGMSSGTWLEGPSIPKVRSDIGVVLAISALRRLAPSVFTGVVARLSAQPLTLSEYGTSWDGGTINEVHLLGMAAGALPRSGAVTARLELAGGMSLLSGARHVYPFSHMSRVVPAADIAIVLGRRKGITSSRTTAPLADRLAVFARYGIVRVDARPGTDASADLAQPTAGFIGRASIGGRITR